MTSAKTTADAYEQWLQIPRSALPPHHYALLGLPPYSADEQLIFQAYQQRAALVGQHLGGAEAALAKRVLSELAAAQACLLNADTRVAYDRSLSQRAAETKSSPGAARETTPGGQSQRPAPRGKLEPPIGAPPASAEIAAPPVGNYRDGEEPSSVVPWLVGGACAGLLAVAVMGVVLYSMGQKSPRDTIARRDTVAERNIVADRELTDANQKVESNRNTRKARREARDAVRDSMGGNRKLVIEVREDDVLGKRIAPLTTKPEMIDTSSIGPPLTGDEPVVDLPLDARDDSDAEPSKDPADAEPAPADTPPAVKTSSAAALAKLPKSFALPSRTSAGARGLLASLPVKDSASVKLSLDAAGVAGGKRFTLADEIPGEAEGERVWPVQFAAGATAPRAVGEYALAGDELSFRWAETAAAGDEALADLALTVNVDGVVKQLNQRTPEAVAPLKLSVESGAVSTTAKIETPPPSAKLYLSLAAQDEAFPAHTLQPAEPVLVGEEVDLIFGEATDPYRLALRVSLAENGAGGIRIESRPMLQAIDAGQKWDYFRPKAVLQTLAQLKQQESLIDAQLQQLSQRFGRNAVQLQQATELYNRQAAALQTRILSLEQMHTLCEELNASGALHYRVFAKLGEREVDLADSTLGITLPAGDGEATGDDPGAIVGPPTGEE